MKKDIEWLKKEIATEMIQLEPNIKERWSDVKYQTLRDIGQKIYQLDEPEVLSQEWIDSNSVNASHDGVTDEYVHVDDLESLLVPKQELPVIPKYIADWIEENRKWYKNSLFEIGYDLYSNAIHPDVDDWIIENEERFTQAWLYGYEVEEEPLYYAFDKVDDSMLIRKPHSQYDNFITKMSKEEWDKLGVNDSNADFIKVEDME